MRLAFIPAMVAVLLFVTAPLKAQDAQPILPKAPLTFATPHGPVTLTVELATSPYEQEMGLMYRRHLAPRAGMLFVFRDSGIQSFWMKNTILPLDMVFIKSDGVISSIHAHAVPFDLDPITSDEPVRYVLEINAGAAKLLGLAPGERASGPALKARE
ncbi:MAG: DUF192 domain-containing protein [Alphaproteobacteria bacterium]|nr:DUF192 domain-containing protein [Alphaproteobacteria bacterium]